MTCWDKLDLLGWNLGSMDEIDNARAPDLPVPLFSTVSFAGQGRFAERKVGNPDGDKAGLSHPALFAA